MKTAGRFRIFGFIALSLIFTLVLSAQEGSGLPGHYRKDNQSGTYLLLTPSFGFILHTQGERRPRTGNYTIEGNELTLIGGVDHQVTVYTVQGESLYAPDGAVWVKEGTEASTPAPQAQVEQPATEQSSTDTSDSIIGKYVRYDNSTDYIELGEIGTFVLVENGKTFVGHYDLTGDSLVMTGSQIVGQINSRLTNNTIIDPHGKVWSKRTNTSATTTLVSQPTHYDAVELPPPPPPPAIKTGMTKAQVVAGYGEPQRKAATGVKEIYFYTDMKMKVTFTNGKVSNVE